MRKKSFYNAGSEQTEIWGNWHITINPNLVAETPAQRQKYVFALKEAVEDIFKDGTLMREQVCMVPRNRSDYGGNEGAHMYNEYGLPLDQTELIRTIRSIIALEEGAENNGSRIHAHVLLEISHESWIHINCGRLRELLNEALLMKLPGFHGGVYVNCRFIKDEVGATFRYIGKTNERELPQWARRFL